MTSAADPAPPAAADDDGFKTVRRRGQRPLASSEPAAENAAAPGFTYAERDTAGRRRRPKQAALLAPPPPTKVVEALRAKLTADATLDAYWQRAMGLLEHHVAAVVALGLGSPHSSPSARVQLALALALRDHLVARGEGAVAMEAFDPCFTAADVALLRAANVTVLERNQVGAHAAAVPTVFVMPHCVRTLYDNVVWANLRHLDRICILGNDLREMATAMTRKELASFPRLDLMSRIATVLPLPIAALAVHEPAHLKTALYQQALHVVSAATLAVALEDAPAWAAALVPEDLTQRASALDAELSLHDLSLGDGDTCK